MNRNRNYTQVLVEIKKLLQDPSVEPQSRLLQICTILQTKLSGYDWVGFYLVKTPSSRILELGPYKGEATDHTRIPFGQGVCGRVAESEEMLLIDDVSKELNYLSCGLHVKSEIVVPAWNASRAFIGQIDIDSHVPAAFSKEDEVFLKNLIQILKTDIEALTFRGKARGPG